MEREGVRSAGFGQHVAVEVLVTGVGRRMEVWEKCQYSFSKLEAHSSTPTRDSLISLPQPFKVVHNHHT